MGHFSMKPLGTGQRMRQARWQRLILKWMRRVLRNRLLLRVVLWTAKVLWNVASLF